MCADGTLWQNAAGSRLELALDRLLRTGSSRTSICGLATRRNMGGYMV
jgi:hypothetical protein